MPFTPYHSGIGILLKSFFLTRFSLVIFLWSQILCDIEVLINIIIDANRLHSWSHTVLGMLAIVLFTCLMGKQVYIVTSKIINNFIKLPSCPTRKVIIYSAVLGVVTHLPLDAIMHYDVRPLFPFSSNNILYGLTSIYVLHLGLAICAGIGIIILAVRQKIKR